MQYLLSKGTPEIVMEIVSNRSFHLLDYREINLFLSKISMELFETDNNLYDYSSWSSLLKKDLKTLHIIEGIELLQKFKIDQISQIEAFLELDNDLFIFVKDQFVAMAKDQKMMQLLPHFSKQLHLARKSQKHLILINELILKSMKLVKENCITFNYLNNFLNSGLNQNELQLIDSMYN